MMLKGIRPFLRLLLPFSCFVLIFWGISVGSSAAGIDTSGTAKADAYARATPARNAKSIEQLGQYLTSPFSTDYLKARAIYTWVISNVEYDVDRAFSGRTPAYLLIDQINTKANPQFAENVLKSKLAVCQGYSNLFKELCHVAGIEVLTVSGYDKGWFYQTNGTLNLSHAWNVVRLDGQWYPVDATWGAGHADEQRHFVSNPTYEFFLTPPAEFVEKHLPSDPAFQLIARPVPMQVFKSNKETIAAYITSGSGPASKWNDTLTIEASLAPELREYRSMKRAIAFQPQNNWARLKLAEFHATRAMVTFGRYQKVLEDAKATQTKIGPEALVMLDEAESELTHSQTWLKGIPGSEKQLSSFASDNSRLIEQNLESIRKQKKYWQERL